MRSPLGRITVVTVVGLAFSLGLLLIALWSVDDAITYVPELHVGEFEAATVQALSYIVFDVQTGTEIASKASEEVLPIASLTKLLTAAMFYESADLNATTSITWSDVNTDGDAGKLKYKEMYSYRELLYPLLLESSNDAAAAMLRVKPNLLTEMESYVESLRLTKTVFADTSGLSDANVSTAYELFVLFKDLYAQYPHVFDITHLSQFIGSNTGWMNNNPFVDSEGYVGGKHGFTYAANRTVFVLFDEELNNGHIRTVGYILLGSSDLKADVGILREEIREKVRYE